jgi:FkbM family methyltransferase
VIARVKATARARMSAAAWGRLQQARARLTDWVTNVWALFAAAPAHAAPDSVTVRVSERTRLVRRLDYPRAVLRMVVTSRIEQRTRLHSSRKEPETVEWLERTFANSSVLYDIGANVGAYSLVAAAVGGSGCRVIAFEPSPFTFGSLCANVLLNDFAERITPLPFLLAEANGVRSFVLESTIAGDASHPGVDSSQTGLDLVAMPLDGAVRLLDLPPATHIKIDVDGGEDAVLDGARETISSPTLRHVLIEVESGRTDLRHIERALAEAGLDRVNVVRHGDTRTYNWVYERRNGRT